MSMLNYSRLGYARLQALSLLDGLGTLTETGVLRGLSDMDESVRERAVLLTPKVARNGAVSDDLWARLKLLAADRSPRVRYQLCFTAGQIIGLNGCNSLPVILALAENPCCKRRC